MAPQRYNAFGNKGPMVAISDSADGTHSYMAHSVDCSEGLNGGPVHISLKDGTTTIVGVHTGIAE